MTEKTTLQICLIVNSDGDYAVGADFDAAADAYDSDIGGGAARRVIKLNVKLALPKEEEVFVEVPEATDPGIETETIAAE